MVLTIALLETTQIHLSVNGPFGTPGHMLSHMPFGSMGNHSLVRHTALVPTTSPRAGEKGFPFGIRMANARGGR